MSAQKLRTALAVALALFAALAVTLGALQFRIWLQPRTSSAPSSQPLTDRQKLDILASLASTSSVSVEEKSKTLHSLSAPAKNTPTEEEKLKILQSLQAKP